MMRRPLNLKAALAAATLCLLAPAWSGQTRGTPERIEPARTAAAQANPVPPTLPPPETAGALKFDVRRSAEGRELTLPFSQIGQVHHPHEVRRGQFRQRLHFELRTDELVRRATLTLMLAPSPDLLGRNDLLVVKLNSETVGRIAVPPASGLDRSGQFSTRLELDPKLLTDSNELTVQFAAPPQCDSAQFPRVSVNGHSSLQLTVQPLPLANDLSVLPSPFFDRRDPGQTEVTLVTSDRPDGSTLQAAGQLASWFGALAGHRGARIRSRADLPAGHAIVLANAQAGMAMPLPAPALAQALGTEEGGAVPDEAWHTWAAGFVQGAELSAAGWRRLGHPLQAKPSRRAGAASTSASAFMVLHALAARAPRAVAGDEPAWQPVQDDGQPLLLGLDDTPQTVPPADQIQGALNLLWPSVLAARLARQSAFGGAAIQFDSFSLD